jgi:hypothetical protein
MHLDTSFLGANSCPSILPLFSVFSTYLSIELEEEQDPRYYCEWSSKESLRKWKQPAHPFSMSSISVRTTCVWKRQASKNTPNLSCCLVYTTMSLKSTTNRLVAAFKIGIQNTEEAGE